MAWNQSAIMLCVVLVLALLTQNKASNDELLASKYQQPQGNNDPLYGVNEGSLRPEECAPKCTNRCSATSFKKPCLFFCKKCCATCLCVPPGTYGNKQVCPCYNNWKTKRGGPKCP